jgi:hypothetical protein
MGNISSHFSYGEFKKSNSFSVYINDYQFSDWERNKIFLLVKTQLQPARDYVKNAVLITNGIRTDSMIEAMIKSGVNASKTSDHLFKGFSCACDFKCQDAENTHMAFMFIRNKLPESFGQLIVYWNSYNTVSHIHTSLPTERHHGEVWEDRPGFRIARLR